MPGEGGGSPFERGVRVAVWIEQTAQFGVPCLRRGVEPTVECVLGSENDRLSVVQPREAAARRGRDDRERPERLGLTCTTTSPETASDFSHFTIPVTRVEWIFWMPLTPSARLTFECRLVVQPGKQHEPAVFMPREMRDALRALLQPLVVPVKSPFPRTGAVANSAL